MTSPYYPQSNGKLERFHQTLKDQALRPLTPLDVEEAKRITGNFIDYYNTTRLHSAIGFIAPKDRLEGRHQQIHADRDKKLEEARRRRKLARQTLAQSQPEYHHPTLPALAEPNAPFGTFTLNRDMIFGACVSP